MSGFNTLCTQTDQIDAMYDEDLKRAVYSKVRKYQDAFLELQDADSIKQRRLTRVILQNCLRA